MGNCLQGGGTFLIRLTGKGNKKLTKNYVIKVGSLGRAWLHALLYKKPHTLTNAIEALNELLYEYGVVVTVELLQL